MPPDGMSTWVRSVGWHRNRWLDSLVRLRRTRSIPCAFSRIGNFTRIIRYRAEQREGDRETLLRKLRAEDIGIDRRLIIVFSEGSGNVRRRSFQLFAEHCRYFPFGLGRIVCGRIGEKLA